MWSFVAEFVDTLAFACDVSVDEKDADCYRGEHDADFYGESLV